MGGCGSTPEQREAARLNKAIESKLLSDTTGDRQTIKLLLLGAGECGKSTILKQMRILHKKGFSTEEKKATISLVRANTLQCIHALCRACIDLEIPLQHDKNRIRSEILLKNSDHPDVHMIAEIKEHVKTLWKDEGVKKAFSRSNEFQLLDSCEYFMTHIDRTFASDYLPTEQDILRTRLPTCGVIENDFVIDKINFKMFDVGGQRGERKKWIHCFEKVRAILFIASLSEYDQVLAEDRTRNRLEESLALFEGIINLSWFKNTAIILFLNKNDIFEKKVTKVDLGIYFNSYVGGLDYEEGLYFIKELYFSKNSNPSKTIYAHVTDATDTDQMAFVWKATKHIVVSQSLKNAQLMT
jgi:GTPase SAR1 family protein